MAVHPFDHRRAAVPHFTGHRPHGNGRAAIQRLQARRDVRVPKDLCTDLAALRLAAGALVDHVEYARPLRDAIQEPADVSKHPPLARAVTRGQPSTGWGLGIFEGSAADLALVR